MLRAFSRITASAPDYIGVSGRKHVFQQLIQERPHIGRVWLARCGQDNFILKDIPVNVYAAFDSGTRAHIKETAPLRLLIDTITGKRIFVYRFLTEDFLTILRKRFSIRTKKEILKASLQGIENLHFCDVVHLDVKPDNIMVDGDDNGSNYNVRKVQLTDLENAAYLPKGRCIKGMLPGNENWQSPEGHLQSELNKATDMFSFGAMCIYAILGRFVFRPDEDMKNDTDQGAIAWIVRLQRQVSYFRDKDGINGLMKHVGDDETSLMLLRNAYDGKDDTDHGYKHFSTWAEVNDESFRDFVLSVMNLDPKKRISVCITAIRTSMAQGRCAQVACSTDYVLYANRTCDFSMHHYILDSNH